MSKRRKLAGMALRIVFATGFFAAACAICQAQEAALPNAPALHLLAASQVPAQVAPSTPPQPPMPAGAPEGTQMSAAQAAGAQTGPRLTMEQAEQMAIRNNPNISVARLLALAQAQVTREARAPEMPFAITDLTAVGDHEGSRITGAGGLNSPRMLEKAAGGLTASQLITDFGRTHNLVRSAQSNARAQLESERATELDITLAADQAFYQALSAQAVLRVAQQTVTQRQATGDQVSALTKAQVKSDLDLSFANVQISQAELLLLDAKNNAQAAMAELNDVMGSVQDQPYTLVDETNGNPPPAPESTEALVQSAFGQRPDLASLNDKYLSAKQYSTAERDLWMPTISAMTGVGATPVRDDLIQSSWYFGAGANISIPVFNGFLFNAEAQEAKLRAQAAQESVRDLRDTIARDVRMAVLNAQTAFQRIGVTQEMLNQANFALDLATARYKIGLSSIVELTQAQLIQTQAEIANANARYSYQTALAEVRYEVGQ